MKPLKFYKGSISLTFGITEDRRLLFYGINDNDTAETLPANRFFTPIELHTTGSNPDDHHGAKHTGGDDLFYDSCFETDTSICFFLKNNKVSVKIVYEFYKNTKTVRAHSEVKNISDESIGLEYIH